MLTKTELDKFALDVGDVASFTAKHYKKLLGGLAGAYLLSKIIPAVHNYEHDKNVEQNEAMQNYYLQNISMNEGRQTAAINPISPNKDSYNYVF